MKRLLVCAVLAVSLLGNAAAQDRNIQHVRRKKLPASRRVQEARRLNAIVNQIVKDQNSVPQDDHGSSRRCSKLAMRSWKRFDGPIYGIKLRSQVGQCFFVGFDLRVVTMAFAVVQRQVGFLLVIANPAFVLGDFFDQVGAIMLGRVQFFLDRFELRDQFPVLAG